MHRLDQTSLLARGQGAQHRADFVSRARVEGGEGRLATRGERQVALPPVVFRLRPLEEAALLKTAQDAAQVSCVQAEIAAQLGRRRPLAVRQLVEDARLAEGEGAIQVRLAEQADLARVEAVEAPHVGHPRLDFPVRHMRATVT